MQIELNKYYRTKDGKRVRCICADMKNQSNSWFVFLQNVGDRERVILKYNTDFIDGPWTEPLRIDWTKLAAWHSFVALDRNGMWWAYTAAPSYREGYWLKGTPATHIPPEYAPVGDISDPGFSLLRRSDPKTHLQICARSLTQPTNQIT